MSAFDALRISIVAAVATIVLKALAWWVTDSVGYLSDALESFVNLGAATFALAMVSLAVAPADDEHPWGHGKAEYLSAGLEGVMILAAAGAIVVVAVRRLISPQPLLELGLGAGFSIAAGAINYGAARVLFASAKAHRSLALEADARHLMTDVWTTGGVIIGVAAATASGWLWLDPVVAIAVAANIVREGVSLVRRAIDGLMDRALPAADVARVEAVLAEYEPCGCRFANLRTRAAGSARLAHVDLLLPANWTVAQAHELADEIEARVEARAGVRITTHVEPHAGTGPRGDGEAAGAGERRATE